MERGAGGLTPASAACGKRGAVGGFVVIVVSSLRVWGVSVCLGEQFCCTKRLEGLIRGSEKKNKHGLSVILTDISDKFI